MSSTRVLFVDCFADHPLAGYSVCVLPEAGAVSAETRRAIATELPADEVIFVEADETHEWLLQVLTSGATQSGYAPVGAVLGLAAIDALEPGAHHVSIDGHRVSLTLTEAGNVVHTELPKVARIPDIDPTAVADALGLPADMLATGDLPIGIGGAGTAWLVVPLSYFSATREITPDWAAVDDLCTQHGTMGIYPLTFDTLTPDSTAHGRVLVAEQHREAVCYQHAAGAAGAYLRHVEALDGDQEEGLRFEQGEHLHRPARIDVQVTDTVAVGGPGTIVLDSELSIPTPSSSDIIEA